MPTPLIATKLYAPPAQARLTARPALWRRLDQAQTASFLLVSAPAGFGKTTLVVEWLRRTEQPFAWLSLEPDDDEPRRFWRYLIAAIQTLVPGAGQAGLALLEAPQLPPQEAIVTPLINDLTANGRPLSLVLDDYHWIQSPTLHFGLNYLLDHLPRPLRLVLTTREDPPLALARRRARRELVEIRASDLRFSRDETATFLNGVLALDLAGDDLAALDERTEGWIAGLQMVGLSLAASADKHAFVRSFAGDDRYIADYLMEEVLQHQPAAVQDFLLRSSVLQRFCAPLCDAVLERTDSAELIRAIEGSNLFVVPLDSHREWYRYHHLFGELLGRRLLQTADAEAVAGLHRRASAWYAQQRQAPEAIEHAVLARDYAQAAGLLEAIGGLLYVQNDLPTLVRWWRAIPVAMRASRPGLNMMCAWALLATGHPDEAGACAAEVDQALDAAGADATLAATVPGARVETAVLRLSVAFNQGESAPVLVLAREIEPLLAEGQIERLGPGLFNTPDNLRPVVRYGLAVGLELAGQLTAASQAYAETETMARPRQNQHLVALAASRLAQVQVIQGQLRAAAATCERALRLAGGETAPQSPLYGITHGVLGQIYYEQAKPEAAVPHLEAGIRLAQTWANSEGLLPSLSGLARARLAQGDVSGALGAADELAQHLRQYNVAALVPLGDALRARLDAEAGRLGPAAEWAQACGLDVEAPWPPARELEAQALAVVWLALGRAADAQRLARRLAAEAEAGERWGRLAESLVIGALAAQAEGRAAEAWTALQRALALAEPEDWVRLFVDRGEPMRQLLAMSPGSSAPGSFTQRLLAAFGSGGEPLAVPAPQLARLAEPLTERELEVLRLIDLGLTNPAIAGRLVISLGTVKSHTANLFGKLGVNSRTQATARARALGLLPADPTNLIH